MKKYLIILLGIYILSGCCNNVNRQTETTPVDYALVIHGGAGNMSVDNMDDKNRDLYYGKLNEALDTGLKILEEGGSSVDAVEMTIRVLENSPLFNAGKGAVFTHTGTNELDASIMDGQTLNAGAVAGVSNIKNPISAARCVMDKSEHLMLSGEGASEFAASQGIEIVDPSYFFTEQRFNSLLHMLEDQGEDTDALKMKKMGTVGCVALDRKGNLAAGTSTGGMTNKKFGRIGDSPVIGAGTYAKNETCGVSCTGHGEYFIRYSVAHDISSLMEYRDMPVQEAAELVINDKLLKAGGSGGVICLDKYGNYSMVFNTKGMFRGFANSEGERIVAVFADE